MGLVGLPINDQPNIFLSSPPSQSVLFSLLLLQPTMAEFLAETLERELDSGIKELVNKKSFHREAPSLQFFSLQFSASDFS